jgi:hypothetical protein
VQRIIASPPYSTNLTLSQYTSNIYIIAKKDINQPKLNHMIIIPILYHRDEYNDNIIDYAGMEREFKREMNLLVDEEIRQDNL